MSTTSLVVLVVLQVTFKRVQRGHLANKKFTVPVDATFAKWLPPSEGGSGGGGVPILRYARRLGQKNHVFWGALVEKALAKWLAAADADGARQGYDVLNFGEAGEALEFLTGGVFRWWNGSEVWGESFWGRQRSGGGFDGGWRGA